MTPALLEGALSIQAALECGSRQIQQLLIDEKKRYDWRVSQLARQADAAGIPLTYRARADIDAMAQGNSHGGMVAVVGQRRFAPLDSLLPDDAPAFIVMLDGIEDPYNFGGAIRALYAAGVDGLVVPPRNWTSASAVVGRASAGASERVNMAVADSADAAAAFFRERGLTIAATAHSAEATSLHDADLTQPLFLLIGGERRGLTRSLRHSDLQLRIPYGRAFAASLGVLSAAAVIAFEVGRQRRGESPIATTAVGAGHRLAYTATLLYSTLDWTVRQLGFTDGRPIGSRPYTRKQAIYGAKSPHPPAPEALPPQGGKGS